MQVSNKVFRLNYLEISRNRMLELLMELQSIQNEARKLKQTKLNLAVIQLIFHVKRIGRLVHLFTVVNGPVQIDNLTDINNSKLLNFSHRTKKPCENIVKEKVISFCKWKVQRWNREYLISKENTEMDIKITCKICLNQVPSRLLEVHSGCCLKRAEAFHRLNELLAQAPKYIENVCEMKQCLVTKIKLDM